MLEGLGLLINTIILLVFLLILNYSSEVCINNAVKVSEITGFSKTTIGFILVAMTTTLPELSVSVLSAIGGEEIGIAIGNALGSNVVNICLIVGVALLASSVIAPSKAKSLHLTIKGDIKTIYSGLFAVAIIPLILVYIGYASRIIGAILVGIFVYQIHRLTRHREPVESNFEGNEGDKYVKRPVILTVLGAFLVVLSAYFIVDSATYIAESLGVPNVVIGATIIAFGTSLPEFANSIKSSLKGHLDLALGNIVGSCFINTTLILGVALLGTSFSVNMQAYTDLATFALMASLLLWYFVSNERVGWKEGVLLLAIYAIFLGQMLGYGIKVF